MATNEREFTINITEEKLRAWLQAMIDEKQFADLFDANFRGSTFFARVDRSDDRPGYTTYITIKPQEGSVRIRVRNETDSRKEEPIPSKFLAWGKIRTDLERSGYQIKDVTGQLLTAVFEHSYIDPGLITNPNHRRVIRALIEAELSPDERVTQKEIANRLGYSEPRFSEIKGKYLRPEFQKPKESE